MQELFIEIFSEEIPARFQVDAAKQFADILSKQFSEYKLDDLSIKTECSMHRIVACVTGIPQSIPGHSEEIRGPRLSAPDQAIEGFMRKYGITKDQLKEEGEFHYYDLVTLEMKSDALCKEVAQGSLHKFTWPKSMHWGQSLKDTWVRPIRSIICILDSKVIKFSHCNVESGNFTYGHRVDSNSKKLVISNYDDYVAKLLANGVIVQNQQRQEMILEQASKIAAEKGLKLREDLGLLAEVCGLVEHPKVLLGSIADHFMQLPDEVLIASIRTNQKYLLLCDSSGRLAPYFLIVADGDYDDPDNIIKGNERVLNARLSDAEFFFKTDLKTLLEKRIEGLKGQVYHSKIGSVYDKIVRMEAIAKKLAAPLNVDAATAAKAVRLCKCDLVTQMVFEFPELQGIMGYYYAINQDIPDEIALSIRDHYRPQGPSDSLPTTALGAVVALSDKIDSLVELFSVGIKPTGNKDPFAQRRAAIGILRILDEYAPHLDLKELITSEEVLKFIEARKSS